MPNTPFRPQIETVTGVHGIITPEAIRENDPITARIRLPSTPWLNPLRVWSLSPLGIEVFPAGLNGIRNGEIVEVEVTFGRQSINYKGFIVRPSETQLTSDRANLIGVRFTQKDNPSLSGIERRGASRWICSKEYDPVAIAANPMKFNDFLYFRVKDISKTGIRAATSLRNKFILPGMQLELQVSLPMTSTITMRAKVERLSLISDDGDPMLEVGFSFGQLGIQQRRAIGQYLIQFAENATLESIKGDGFFPASLTKSVDYSYIRSDEEYLEVLDLRLRANKAVGKVPPDYGPDDMADIYDTRSRIIVGKFRGKIIGTIRVTFCEENQRLEHELYTPLPEDFPRGHSVLECSRAATDPMYRGSDLWTTLLQHVAILALIARREWTLISTTGELVNMYVRIGFKDSGITYVHPTYPGVTQHILLINVIDAVNGIGVGPIYWNVIWKDVARFVSDQGRLTTGTKVKIYSLFSPIAGMLRALIKRPRRNSDAGRKS
jgi:hypothetical protein